MALSPHGSAGKHVIVESYDIPALTPGYYRWLCYVSLERRLRLICDLEDSEMVSVLESTRLEDWRISRGERKIY